MKMKIRQDSNSINNKSNKNVAKKNDNRNRKKYKKFAKKKTSAIEIRPG